MRVTNISVRNEAQISYPCRVYTRGGDLIMLYRYICSAIGGYKVGLVALNLSPQNHIPSIGQWILIIFQTWVIYTLLSLPFFPLLPVDLACGLYRSVT